MLTILRGYVLFIVAKFSTRGKKIMSLNTKSWFVSKTIWGVIIQLIALGTYQLGYDIGEQGMWVNAIVGLIGAVLTIIGRIKAVKKIV